MHKRSKAASLIVNSFAINGIELTLLRNITEVESGKYRDLDFILLDNKINDLSPSQIQSDRFLFIKKIERFRFMQYIIFDREISEVFILDFWDGLYNKGLPYYINNIQLNLKVNRKRLIPCLSEKTGNLIAITKCITQSGQIKDKYINDSIVNIGTDLIDEFGYDYTKLLEKSKISRFLRHLHASRYHIVNLFRWLVSFTNHYFKKNLRVVYILGPDGCGKTSLAKYLIDGDSLSAEIEYYHGRIPFLPRANRLKPGNFNRLNVKEEPNLNAHIEQPHIDEGKFTLLHLMYYVVDGLLSSIKLFTKRYKDLIVISDRSPYDIVARDNYGHLPGIFKEMLIWSAPRPDICVLLTAPAEVIHARKPELSEEKIDYQYALYRAGIGHRITREIDTQQHKKTINDFMELASEYYKA
jgi:hypothetical protein